MKRAVLRLLIETPLERRSYHGSCRRVRSVSVTPRCASREPACSRVRKRAGGRIRRRGRPCPALLRIIWEPGRRSAEEPWAHSCGIRTCRRLFCGPYEDWESSRTLTSRSFSALWLSAAGASGNCAGLIRFLQHAAQPLVFASVQRHIGIIQRRLLRPGQLAGYQVANVRQFELLVERQQIGLEVSRPEPSPITSRTGNTCAPRRS